MIPEGRSEPPADSEPPRPNGLEDAALRPIRRNGSALALAVGVFGATFGVLSSESGLSSAQTMAMSMLVFTGASQFAAVSVIGAGGATVTAVASALLLALRNGVYGLSLSKRLTVRGWRRWVGAQLVIDESTAMAVAEPDDVAANFAFWWTGIAVFVCWNFGTLLGLVAGNAVGEPEKLGLDAAFPAGFVALVMPQLRDSTKRSAALLGATVAAVAVPFVRPGVPVLLAAPAAVVAVAISGRRP
jgi:4-azaleucine resistance transporter AzlC